MAADRMSMVPGIDGFVMKPVIQKEMADTIQKLLDAEKDL
jgi:hypothetical protein